MNSPVARPGARWSLPRGRILKRVLRNEPTQEYLVYVPSTGGRDAPIFVSVHGISRNAPEQAAVFQPFCENLGAVLLVPRFTPKYHRDYQRLGRESRGIRADLVLERCLNEVSMLSGADGAKIFLFGYSGGAQFAHRFTMAHPHRVARAVFAASGWYTMPDHKRRFPYGIRPTRQLTGVAFNPEEFLRVPMHVLVGELDVADKNMRHTERLDRQQGKTRLERAHNWVAAMRQAAVVYGLPPLVTIDAVADIDHSFKRFCRRGALPERVMSFLFDVETESAVVSV